MLAWCCQNGIKHGLQERSYGQSDVFKEKFRSIGGNIAAFLVILAKVLLCKEA